MRGKIGKRSSQALSTKAPNHPRSRKTLPCSKGIETFCQSQVCVKDCVERPCPVPKGLRLMENSLLEPDSSPRPAPKGLKQSMKFIQISIVGVERPRPVPKGLRPVHFRHLLKKICRKTPPCSKGIETLHW